MVPVVGTLCAGALYVNNVQLALALITGLSFADARFYSKYHPIVTAIGSYKDPHLFLNHKVGCN